MESLERNLQPAGYSPAKSILYLGHESGPDLWVNSLEMENSLPQILREEKRESRESLKINISVSYIGVCPSHLLIITFAKL